jgi:hypothetical protein
MPDSFLLIIGLIAIATVILYPIRLWRRKRHRYGTDDGSGVGDVPLAAPDRRDSD